MKLLPIDSILALVGSELGVSDWVMLDQDRITRFAEVTEDFNDVHLDDEVGRQWGLGGTIAHGFLTLSMILRLQEGIVPQPVSMTHGYNYGLDRVRFLSPVPSGSRVRGRFMLNSATERKPGEWLFTLGVTIEVEGQAKPALSAQWLMISYLPVDQ